MRLRFTIRDLLWLTLVVAVCAGWWFDACRRTGKINELQLELRMAPIEPPVQATLEWLARHPQP